ncbi:hypothetical protein PC116_g34739, partial [Phytophthora cactorum]
GAEGAAGDSAPANAEGPQRPRKVGIRRADILRKAEQAVVRAQEGPKPTSAKSRGSVSSSKTPAADEGKQDDVVDDSKSDDGVLDEDVEMKDDEGEDEGEGEGDLSSAPGSVHDSADDESDLSDAPPEDVLDEDELRQLMFPNLTRRSLDTTVENSDSESRGEDSSDEETKEAED